MKDRIEKSVEIDAPASRVWQALTDHREFGQWFGVRLESPFKVGRTARGNITHPGFEHIVFEATVVTMEPERRFSYTWHPYPIDPDIDYSAETPTLVEFMLEPKGDGTLLRVTESGFGKIPEGRRAEAFRMNEGGWEHQMRNIQAHVAERV